jgi:hypothetical protein
MVVSDISDVLDFPQASVHTPRSRGRWRREGEWLLNYTAVPSFDGLDREGAIEAIVEWFGENFQDPVHEMPYNSREGGYQYIYGGPYDAAEEVSMFESDLTGIFGDEESLLILEGAVDRIQQEGTYDWAPINVEDAFEPDEAPPLTEAEAREEVVSRLDELTRLIEARPYKLAGIGHNQPPEPIEDMAQEINWHDLESEVLQAKVQARAKRPDKEIVSQIATSFQQKVEEYKATIAVVGAYLGIKLADKIVEWSYDQLFAAIGNAAEAMQIWASLL